MISFFFKNTNVRKGRGSPLCENVRTREEGFQKKVISCERNNWMTPWNIAKKILIILEKYLKEICEFHFCKVANLHTISYLARTMPRSNKNC